MSQRVARAARTGSAAVNAVAVVVLVAAVNLIGAGAFSACGDAAIRPPHPGSARAGMCAFWRPPHGGTSLMAAVIFYAPTLIAVVLAIAAARSDRPRLLRVAARIGVGGVLLIVAPLFVLPG